MAIPFVFKNVSYYPPLGGWYRVEDPDDDQSYAWEREDRRLTIREHQGVCVLQVEDHSRTVIEVIHTGSEEDCLAIAKEIRRSYEEKEKE